MVLPILFYFLKNRHFLFYFNFENVWIKISLSISLCGKISNFFNFIMDIQLHKYSKSSPNLWSPNSLSWLICCFVFIYWKSLIHELFYKIPLNSQYFSINDNIHTYYDLRGIFNELGNLKRTPHNLQIPIHRKFLVLKITNIERIYLLLIKKYLKFNRT